MIRTFILLVCLLCGLSSAIPAQEPPPQGPSPGLLQKLQPLLPPATITRGFTWLDVANRREYVYKYTVGAVQSRIVLLQEKNPRLYLLFPTIDEQKARNVPDAIHNGYFSLLVEEKNGHYRKVFDSFEAFGERLLDRTHLAFGDLDGDGVKDIVAAAQFSSTTGEVASSLFVYTWDSETKRYIKIFRERQQGEWARSLRIVPTVPGGAGDIFVERPANNDDRKHFWWLYAYAGGTMRRIGYGGPIPGQSWIAEVGPGRSWQVITARWIPMDTPDGTFLDKSEVTFWRRAGGYMEDAHRFFTFQPPFELTKEVPRDYPIPGHLTPWYFSPRLMDMLPRRTSMVGEEEYPLFPERGRRNTALNFYWNGRPYTALAYVLYKVKNVGEANPAVDPYLRSLKYPHQKVDELEGEYEVIRRLQCKVLARVGDRYRDVWTSPAFPEGHVFEKFIVNGEGLAVQFRVRGQVRTARLRFQ